MALLDPRLAEVVDNAADPLDYVRVMLRVSDGIADVLDGIADAVVTALKDSVVARYGATYVPRQEEVAELRRILTDYRVLGSRVVGDLLRTALQRHLVDAVAEYPARDVLEGNWEPVGVPRGSHSAGRGVAAEPLGDPHGDDRQHRQRGRDHVDDRSLVGPEQVSEDPDR